MPEFKYTDVEEEVSTAQHFDFSNLPTQHHEWVQQGSQPQLYCALHRHTAAIPRGYEAAPDKEGNFTLRRMG